MAKGIVQYRGTRRDTKGKKYHVVYYKGEEHGFDNSPTFSLCIIGGNYETDITENGFKGGLKFVDRLSHDHEDVKKWSKEQRLFEVEHQVVSKQKSSKMLCNSAWKKDIETLRTAYKQCAPAQRPIFISLILAELTR